MIQIPAWPAADAPAGRIFFGAASACFTAWKAKGVSRQFAIAMTTMAEAESSFDPNAIGDHDQAFGLYQWHPARCAAILAGTGIDIIALVKARECTIAQGVDAAWHEFSSLPWLGMTAIASAATPYWAAYEATALFERASAEDAAKRRGAMADRWNEYFAQKGL